MCYEPRSINVHLPTSRIQELKGRGEARAVRALRQNIIGSREPMMPSPFGAHHLKLLYEPVADLLAKYARRDPGKTAIVDLESGTAIDFGRLDRIAIDIAAYLKSKGIIKGSRVLVLSDECLEKLLIWFGVWRIGAVICPFNLEINEKQMVDADRRAQARADPLSQGHRRCRHGRRRAGRARALRRVVGGRRERSAGRIVRGAAARRRGATARAQRTPRTPPASSAPPAPRRGRRSSSTTTPPTG